eukprot:gnl/Trimastix_PCT/4155.p1 GENE.gnl/Trimastix_PCT/4155~~gnl/Trimastix_PCT/4155.p1  ORF type:complete len:391 (-),score=77.42 gnl/Trimastix_PCT/4155:51-1223(-)
MDTYPEDLGALGAIPGVFLYSDDLADALPGLDIRFECQHGHYGDGETCELCVRECDQRLIAGLTGRYMHDLELNQPSIAFANNRTTVWWVDSQGVVQKDSVKLYQKADLRECLDDGCFATLRDLAFDPYNFWAAMRYIRQGSTGNPRWDIRIRQAAKKLDTQHPALGAQASLHADPHAPYRTRSWAQASPAPATSASASASASISPAPTPASAPSAVPTASGDPAAPPATSGKKKRRRRRGKKKKKQAKMCRFYLIGECDKGARCPNSHTTPSGRPPCHDFAATGECDSGARCRYEHIRADPPFTPHELLGLLHGHDSEDEEEMLANATGLGAFLWNRYNARGDDSDSDGWDDPNGMCGFSGDEVNELLCQGVKPWDDDAWDVLAALNGF